MADPFTIVGIIEGSLSLILQCGSVAKSLNDLAGKYKQASLSILSMAQEVDTIELAWSRIKNWSEECSEAGLELTFLERLNRSIDCGTLVISALQQDLSEYTGMPEINGIKQRSKATWNERALRDHQHRLRGQATAMTLLLQALDLPSSVKRAELLQTKEDELQRSDASAYSIVPSTLSTRFSRSSYASSGFAELLHRRLSCEDDLFTARVYKRNFKNLLARSLRRPRLPVGAKKLPEQSAVDYVERESRPGQPLFLVDFDLGGLMNQRQDGEQAQTDLPAER